MINFGKMTALPKIIEVDDIKYPVTLFCNDDGIHLFNLAKDNPHPFYIAVDGQSRVVSMTDDIQQSQIAGYDIIGIDSDYGETFEQGGSVYGKVWNGKGFSTYTEVSP